MSHGPWIPISIWICVKNKIPIYEFETIEKISKYIGKNNKAVIGIKDINFSHQIIKNINGGDLLWVKWKYTN